MTFNFCRTIFVSGENCLFTQLRPHDPHLHYLKELHSNTSKHELQQRGDDHNVADGPDGHKDALDYVL